MTRTSMMNRPVITAIAPWLGSKRKLAPRIVAERGAVSGDVSKAMAAQGRRDKTNDVRVTEVFLVNGPSLVESHG